MKHLLLLFSVLLLSLQSAAFAATHETTATPDSVSLFAYATRGDDGRSGLRFAWSMDGKHWFEIGRNYGYLRCDYSRWGSQKKMLDPNLKQLPGGEWLCVWKLNDHDGYGQARSKDLIYWEAQQYPRTTSDFEGTRVKAKIAGHEETGTVSQVPWSVVDRLTQTYERNQYRNSLYGERPVQDKERFAGLKPVKATVTAQPEETKEISDLLMGIFFEDINYSADGGLYAELIQNRDFEYEPSDREGDKNWNSTHSWKLEGENATFTISTSDPIHPNNPHYAVLKTNQPGAALTNTGFDGIALKAGEKYDFSLFARIPEGSKSGKLLVHLVDADGTVQGETTVTVSSRSWKTYKAVLTAKASADTRLELRPQSAGEIELDMISLFPQNTFKGRKNGLRPDLAQTLADMHPRFVRFPGGCVAHGDGLKNIYQWKNTIGPLEARKPARNLWGYHQSMGLGYYEYFQFCEDIGAEPLPVLAAGVPCQNSACHGDLRGGQQGGIPMSEMGAYIQDILDLIEWANGDAKKTKWGKIRAESGHPKPFNLKYIGIGNEDLITDVFEERFTMIYLAIKEKYPEIIVVGTVGPFNEGTDYVEGWKLADKLGVPMVDEHYYQSPGWFLHNQDFYDKYDRSKKTKVYLGEYATHIPGRRANMETALTEALYLAALERNGDVVHMSSYAPLLAKDGRTQWNPDLIYFNNREVRPTTGYYVQKLYGQNAGDHYIPSQINLDNQDSRVKLRVGSSIVRDSKTGDVIVKLVNLLPVSIETDVRLPGMDGIQSSATRTVLAGAPETTPLPVTDTIEAGTSFKQELPAYSFTVIRLKTQKGKNKQ
ncbi:carbohydrate binding domain-containing protein [Bacteroides thetaiotaomicron]|uniref:alpha-L-arabinofuranosidase C-terminal domain-containing protein n=1 Tax=Bacteroides thetaiotaomicron TaxID=818 RepID=UPI001C3849B4|nr:alpha-L-arabinofuranosidase C-terminal domain-containing protein [Bacteroides thetaiotaomicron]MBV4310364.1 carbohydrate binding domain-containing protein [Bacteroides thetaiotaomicron]MBV4329264.1 carbohydrate binding domain-containing protein [Bacteroides thetaiotaomicron]MCB7382779.1 carbohydrate binding domain-containing protein [Bacteroides thetaiotaomicron]MCG4882452.1 carbohydrate binding domain-containing protein [Bacteroides thetaiotaomicron]MCQ5249071.1 carbohydrate binding domain